MESASNTQNWSSARKKKALLDYKYIGIGIVSKGLTHDFGWKNEKV